MSSIKAAARRAGVLYLLLAIIAPFNLMYVPSVFFVYGDATATARNILAGELTYRIGIFGGLVAGILFLLLVLSLYNLLKDVDRKLARLMVLLVAVSATIGIVNLLNQSAALILLSGADFLSVFSTPQLEALAFSFLRLHGYGTSIDQAFWGLWLLPFGVLVIRSGFFPKVLGVLLIIGCVAYLAVSFTFIVLPAYRQVVNQVALPFYAIGELFMIIYLLVKGARVQESGARPAPAG